MTLAIPDSHRDLLEKPVHATLTTLMPDGQPQCSIVWADYDGEYVLINTTLERQKGQNMRANPHVGLLLIDPANGNRWIEIRGTVVEMTSSGASEHADKLTQRYSTSGKRRFYGDVYPVEQQSKETRVIVKIRPVKITLDAVFK
ncbi:MAG TPA: PPOX class F420-dependent oxidoreductase [Aggregatilineales bacterium]|nr:PPOX class F420-dependent oxidoreductase [Aggregatilineales bacterium]